MITKHTGSIKLERGGNVSVFGNADKVSRNVRLLIDAGAAIVVLSLSPAEARQLADDMARAAAAAEEKTAES